MLYVSLQAQVSEQNSQIGFQCPPCGMDHCLVIRPDSGACPDCGMALIRSDILKQTTKTVAILLFDGVQIMDFTGPYEVFTFGRWNVYTIARSKNALNTAGNLSVNPDYDFTDFPQPDIIVIPGGHELEPGTNDLELNWIKQQAEIVDNVMSVCNGAVSLAHAGLLKNMPATTHHSAFERLKQTSPTTTVIRDKKWVDNGKIITAAGLSSGIDASLYLISRYRSIEEAEQITRWLEYRWVKK